MRHGGGEGMMERVLYSFSRGGEWGGSLGKPYHVNGPPRFSQLFFFSELGKCPCVLFVCQGKGRGGGGVVYAILRVEFSGKTHS